MGSYQAAKLFRIDLYTVNDSLMSILCVVRCQFSLYNNYCIALASAVRSNPAEFLERWGRIIILIGINTIMNLYI